MLKFFQNFIILIMFRCPFDWRTPSGYSVAWFAQFVGLAGVITNAVLLFGIVFGSNWLFIVMADDIKSDLAAFNDNNTVEVLKNRNHADLLKRFIVTMQNYVNAKQWVKSSILWIWLDLLQCHLINLYLRYRCVNNFNQMCNFTLFSFFSWNMLAISSLLVALQFLLVEYWQYDNE